MRAAPLVIALVLLAPCAWAATASPSDSAAVRAAIDQGNAAFVRAKTDSADADDDD